MLVMLDFALHLEQDIFRDMQEVLKMMVLLQEITAMNHLGIS